MNLDLSVLTEGWDRVPGEIAARIVRGMDGANLVQLRVDLGVLQMHPEGRPDGRRYRGHASVLDFARHEHTLGREIGPEDWNELQRELCQSNYRRLATTGLAEEARQAGRQADEKAWLVHVLDDIDACLTMVEMLNANGIQAQIDAAFKPTLMYHRAHTLSRYLVLDEEVDDAIEALRSGERRLMRYLREIGAETDARENDQAIAALRDLEKQLREAHGIKKTLEERLADAVAQENFETAAQLRDELHRRRRNRPARLAMPDEWK
jgi:hypothetical protein